MIKRLVLGPFQSNCYIVYDEATRDAIIIDPGDEANTILATVAELGVSPRLIIATHGHIDHILAAHEVREASGAPLVMHQGDRVLVEGLPQIARRWIGVTAVAPMVDRWLEAGETVGVGDMQFEVRLTPGHSWGSVSLYQAGRDGEPGVVFSGDALFAGGIGRTDLGGDFETLAHSIHEQLFTLPDDTLVLSGHGGPTTIGQERRMNPWVGREAGAV